MMLVLSKNKGEGTSNSLYSLCRVYYKESLSRDHEDNSEKQEEVKKEIKYFQRKWKKGLSNGDPFYNYNLIVDRKDFSLRI